MSRCTGTYGSPTLVAYDNSDSSDYEDESFPNEVKEEVSITRGQIYSIPTETEQNGNLFNLLPQPNSMKSQITEEDDEFLHKKETLNIPKPKAKITVPSLSDFKDVDHIASNKPKPSCTKKSGLLSMLPQPKHVAFTTKSMIPHVLTKIPTNNVKKKPLPPPAVTTSVVGKNSLALNYSDDSDDDEVQNDFFSINKSIEVVPIEDTPLDNITKPNHVPSVKRTPNIESYFKQDVDQIAQEEYVGNAGHSQEIMSVPGCSNGYVEPEPSGSGNITLDDEAIRKLCGSRGKRKREEIQIVDINQQEVLGDSREWLVKGLMDDTTKRVSASKKKGNEPTSQQKRKHQITYLAHQAKANEAELQNQWANNRMSKRQTQSKYGF